MNIPKLRKEKTIKTYHGYKLIDNYRYVDQPNILNVLKKELCSVGNVLPAELLSGIRKNISPEIDTFLDPCGMDPRV